MLMDTVSPIGRPLPRVDGPLKVSGTAAYTADHHFPGLLFAVPVPATITSGVVDRIDTSVAVAENLEEAEAAARAVRVTYRRQPFDVSHELPLDGPLAVDSQRGDAAR